MSPALTGAVSVTTAVLLAVADEAVGTRPTYAGPEFTVTMAVAELDRPDVWVVVTFTVNVPAVE